MSDPLAVAEEAEIVVVGGGPSGATAAAVLAELGHDVLLVDKDEFPREKPCGDGLMHPAVAAAERIGLHDLIESRQEIEAARIVVGHRRQSLTRLTAAPGRPRPRCVVRSDFDAALLGAARERGVRFLRARVDGLGRDAAGRRVIATAGGDPFALRAGTVIAADGATSRVRRAINAAPTPPAAYAVRQYYLSAQPLDPVFDFYVPLEIDGRVLSGYGWVFPLDRHTANVGVGFYRDPRRGSPPLTRVLEAFVAELEAKAAHRFGGLEAIGPPCGSPLGIRARVEGSGAPDVLFCGDAAGTTHAMTGEGIAFAMRGGRAIATAVHGRRRLNGGSGRAASDARAPLARPFPQLGVDVSMLNRMWVQEMTKGASGSTGSAPKPFLGVVKRMMGESAYETGAEGTPAWSALDRGEPSLAVCLEAANDALLDRLANQMPFVTEVIHRCSRSHLGPVYAAVALATAGAEAAAGSSVFEAAIAAESVAILPELLTMLVDRAGSKALRVNNAFAILTADFAATRALAAAAHLGPAATTALALACQRGCEGGMRDSVARFAADRGAEDWFQAAEETAGAAAVLATQLGAIVAGRGDAEDEGLRRYGIELGVAVRLAEEIVDLCIGDPMHPGSAGADLRRGIYPLPVLFAIELDESLPRLLARHSAEDGAAAEVIEIARATGGLERAIAECGRRSERAQVLAHALPGQRGGNLARLAALPAEYVAARVGAVESVPDAQAA